MYNWLVFLHVVSALGFMMAHGVSVSVAFALRRERHPERVRALLGLSADTYGCPEVWLRTKEETQWQK
jgi:hypothetical protein